MAENACNESETFVPNWLTIEFVEKHLQNHYSNDQIKVTKWTVELATAKGENFASELYRVKVNFGSNTAVVDVSLLCPRHKSGRIYG